jgi:hypothetical protein
MFKGRQGGFLWLQPTLERRYEITAAQVPPAEVTRVHDGVEFASYQEADTYVRNLAQEAADLGLIPTELPPTTTTTLPPTTTSTTLPPTTTTLPPPTTTAAG